MKAPKLVSPVTRQAWQGKAEDWLLHGQPQEPEYKVTTTAAIYDAQGKKLQEARSGKIYTFDPKSGVLFSGANKFEKLK